MPQFSELPMVNEGIPPATGPNRLPPITFTSSAAIQQESLRHLCLEAGADDVGFVEIDRSDLEKDRPDILKIFPQTKTLVSFVIRMNREPIRSPARSIANLEFHQSGDRVNEVAHDIVHKLEIKGIRAINPAMGFPMEMDKFPGKIWMVSHKTVAVAAGLGQMGIHRNVIHPKFGNFILLGTVLMDAEVTATNLPIEFNPCFGMQVMCRRLPRGRDWARWSIQFFRMLYPQLPGIHGGIH